VQCQARKRKKRKKKEKRRRGEYLHECDSKYRTPPLFKRAEVQRGFFRPLSATILMLYFILIHYAGIRIETLIILLTDKSRNTRVNVQQQQQENWNGHEIAICLMT